jgi:hypothetical protein
MNHKARTLIGKCNIGQHARKGEYVLLQFRGTIMVGPAVQIAKDEMADRGLATVLRYLRDGPPPDSTPFCFHDLATKRTMLKLKREHVLVSVALWQGDNSEMEFIPLHARRGWSFEMHADEVRKFLLPAGNDEFLKELGVALEAAT